MGLFSKKSQVVNEPVQTEAERSAILRDYAIEYLVSLPKADKEKFFEAVDLIWQGYDKLDRVKTKDEKIAERVAKADKAEDDDLAMVFLEDDKPLPVKTAPVSAATIPNAAHTPQTAPATPINVTDAK